MRRDASGGDAWGVGERVVYGTGRDSGPAMSRGAAGIAVCEGVCLRLENVVFEWVRGRAEYSGIYDCPGRTSAPSFLLRLACSGITHTHTHMHVRCASFPTGSSVRGILPPYLSIQNPINMFAPSVPDAVNLRGAVVARCSWCWPLDQRPDQLLRRISVRVESLYAVLYATHARAPLNLVRTSKLSILGQQQCID